MGGVGDLVAFFKSLVGGGVPIHEGQTDLLETAFLMIGLDVGAEVDHLLRVVDEAIGKRGDDTGDAGGLKFIWEEEAVSVHEVLVLSKADLVGADGDEAIWLVRLGDFQAEIGDLTPVVVTDKGKVRALVAVANFGVFFVKTIAGVEGILGFEKAARVDVVGGAR